LSATITDPATHRKLAVELFNFVWSLMDKPQRTTEENDTMLHAAHASRYHWEVVGTAVNLARGEWQVSRVYSVLGRAEPAHWHAQRCLDLCQQHGIGDFDLAYAWEALARAASVAGRQDDVQRHLAKARAAAINIKEDDDRQQFDSDLATIHTDWGKLGGDAEAS
jgi:hypothetical protein